MMTRTGHAENVYPGCRFHGTPDRQSRRRSAHAYDPMGRLTQVIDAGGTQTRTYNQYGDVVTENYPLGAASSSLISRSYDSLGRQTLVSLNNSCVASYTFDSVTGRYASIGNGTAVMTYGYLPQTDQISSQSWKVGTSAAFLTISNTYDAFTRPTRIDANSAMQATYAYDVMNRRTSAAIQDSSCWQYSYNPRMEVTSAVRKNASSVTQNTMRYDYDTIGNRTSSYENPTSKTYLSNNRNQYEEITSGSSTTYPGYDNDGNMTENGSWEYRWDSENRLILAKNGTKKIVFTYDAFSRRITKKVYSSTSLSKHERYVYDGDKLLAVYNERSSYAKTASFQ